MFSCCRCTNPKKDKTNIKKDKNEDDNDDDKKEQDKNDPVNQKSKDIIEIRLKPDNDLKKSIDDIQRKDNNDKLDKTININDENEKVRTKSDSSNTTIEESIIINNKSNQIESIEQLSLNNEYDKNLSDNSVPNNLLITDNKIINNSTGNNNTNTTTTSSTTPTTTAGTNDTENDQSTINNCLIKSDNHKNNDIIAADEDNDDDDLDTIKDIDIGIIMNGDLPKSCISRRSSSKSSIRKKVNINDSTEVIPDIASIDDDEVFSDSIPAKLPRGDMCAPYIKKRGSIPGCFILPEWFNNDERFYYTEEGGVLEPPVTPVGRDELALKRHRMYSELLYAAQAAVEHRVRFDPYGPDFANEDCDPDLKPSATAELENLVNRLEKLVDRLERSVSARELEIANRTFDSVIENKRRSFDLENTELPPIPEQQITINTELIKVSDNLDQRIDRLETCLNHINNNFKRDTTNIQIQEIESNIIPTVLDQYLTDETNNTSNMVINSYKDIVNGSLAQFINLSNTIGGEIAEHAKLVKLAFEAQLNYIIMSTQIGQPHEQKQTELLKPTCNHITAIQNFREKNRASPFFNHLSAISESIPALGWVCVKPAPGPYVKEMNDAGQFYTNRVLKDWKEKGAKHVEWARSWVQTLNELQQYIKQYHTTGLVWSGKGGAPPPPPAGGMPPPPPPPVTSLGDMSLNAEGDERSALFAQINQGEGITRNLKKVTADMQTHKNPTLRTGPAPFKTPEPFSTGPAKPAANKEPVFNRDGKKWLIEYQKSNPALVVENAEMNNVVYMYKCENSTLTVKGKINSVVMDSCKKCSILFDSVVASVEFVNCQSMQMQVLGKVPTISIDKTDGCQMYLSKTSMDVEIISSKSSEMNVLIPKDNGEFIEQPIPEQYKTTIRGTSLQTICVESLG